MKRFHLFYGLAIVIIFLLTGQYMEYVQNREQKAVDQSAIADE